MKFVPVVLLATGASACSYVEVAVPDEKAPNGTKYVIGRTNEFGHILGVERYSIKVHPRESKRFGYLALEGSVPNPMDAWIALDGMNEAGLSVGCQAFQDSVYESPSLPERDVLAQTLVGTLLRECGSVEEALTFLEGHRVVGPGAEVGLHWAITDTTGRSIVVEYLRGKRVVWENTPRVMTNSPQLDFHWHNLNNYVNVNPSQQYHNDMLAVETEIGKVPQTVGNGWNLAGLPGDGSPPSRFVQLFYLRGYATHVEPPKTSEDGIVLVTGLLNRVFIPYGIFGSIRSPMSLVESSEYTAFGMIKIPFEKKVLVRGYKNLQWRQVDMSQLSFKEHLEWPVEDGSLGIEDITAKGSGIKSQLSV